MDGCIAFEPGKGHFELLLLLGVHQTPSTLEVTAVWEHLCFTDQGTLWMINWMICPNIGIMSS